MSFSQEQMTRLRNGLDQYRVRTYPNGSAVSWEHVKDDLLVSPATFGLKSGVGGLSANALERFAAGHDGLTTTTLANLKSFLLHEKLLQDPLWSEDS